MSSSVKISAFFSLAKPLERGYPFVASISSAQLIFDEIVVMMPAEGHPDYEASSVSTLQSLLRSTDRLVLQQDFRGWKTYDDVKMMTQEGFSLCTGIAAFKVDGDLVFRRTENRVNRLRSFIDGAILDGAKHIIIPRTNVWKVGGNVLHLPNPSNRDTFGVVEGLPVAGLDGVSNFGQPLWDGPVKTAILREVDLFPWNLDCFIMNRQQLIDHWIMIDTLFSAARGISYAFDHNDHDAVIKSLEAYRDRKINGAAVMVDADVNEFMNDVGLSNI